MIYGLGWLAGFRIIPENVGFSESPILSRIWGFRENIEIYIRRKSISCEYGILYSQMSAGLGRSEKGDPLAGRLSEELKVVFKNENPVSLKACLFLKDFQSL